MSCSRRLTQQVVTLLLQARVGLHNSSTIAFRPEMRRALHNNALGGQRYNFSPNHLHLWSGNLPASLIAVRQQQQQQQQSSHHQPVPLLAHRRPWRQHSGLCRHPAAAASFTASTPSHGLPSDDDGPEGELHAVETAIRANALIFAAKLAVFFMSNSSAMLAEAVHSVVDIANQMLLRIGIKKAQKQPNAMHPYGYARDQFIWPLISAVGIFCCGAGVSFVHGVTGLFEVHKELGDLYWNFVVLGVSGVLESHSLYVAVDTLRRRATQQGMSLLSYIKTGADPAAVAVMMEDGAAVAGLFIAGGCLALCQATGAVYWDSIGSIAVSGLLGVVAVTLIQRNRKWLIGKSMPKAQEDQILQHLLNDHVIRTVSNIKSEELGVRQYRFQADIAFDGEELARRALDRCGRVRLFKALDAAIRRHDPHALDALLMQFAAVIVSTTGAEVDRMEREIMRLVPGTRWVDLETDRGRPARLSSAYAAAAAAVAAGTAHPPADNAVSEQQEQQQQPQPNTVVRKPERAARRVWPLDSVSDEDHLAELKDYPLGSLSSWDEAQENAPEWIRSFSYDHGGLDDTHRGGGSGSSPSVARLTGADSHIVGGNYLSHEQMFAIEEVLVEGAEDTYKPFCNAMLQQLQAASALSVNSSSQPVLQQLPPSAATSVVTVGSSSVRGTADGLNLSWEMQQPSAADSATQQQLADWKEAEQTHWNSRSMQLRPTGRYAQPPAQAAAAVQSALSQQSSIGAAADADAAADRGMQPGQQAEEQWGQALERRTMQKLLELEDSVLARDGDPHEYKPFCESMFQSLHPDQPKLRRSAAARQQQQQQQQKQKQHDHQQEQQQHTLDLDEIEPEPKQHMG